MEDGLYYYFLKQQIKEQVKKYLEENPILNTEGLSEEQIKIITEGRIAKALKFTRPKAEEIAQVLWLRHKCENDLFFLGYEILGLKSAKNLKGKPRIDPIMHGQMCEEISRGEDTLLLYPRNHMKSTWHKIYAVQQILKNPDVRIGWWTKTTTLAKKELKSIKSYMRNKNLQSLYPDRLKSKFAVDNAQELTVWRDPESTVQENQIEVWGIENTVVGHHYDIHIYDDVIDQDSVRSATGIEQVKTWWEHMQAVKDLGAIEKVVGTRYHLMDIYGYIMREKLFGDNNIIIHSAIENNKPIYAMYTKQDLANLKKKMGDAVYSAQMLNHPVAESDKIFIAPYPLYDVLKTPKKRTYYMAVDPAATTSASADKTGITIGYQVDEDKSKIYVEESYGVKIKPEKLCDEMVRQMAIFRPKNVGIELGLQQAIMPLLSIKMDEWEIDHPGEYIRPRFTEIKTGNTPKPVKLERILGAAIRDNRILFPGVWHGDIFREAKTMDSLFLQMEMYNPNSDANEDDIVDSVNMLIQTVEGFAAAHWGNVNRDNPQGGLNRDFILKNYGQDKKRTGWDAKFA